MTLPEQVPAIRSAPTGAATACWGLLAVVLLVAAAALIRTAPVGDGAAEVRSASIDRTEDDEWFGAEDLPHAGLDPEHSDARRTAVEDAAVGPVLRADEPPSGAFGHDVDDDCRLRNRILPRDLSPVIYRPGSSGCVVSGGVLDDPYLGRPVPYTDEHADRVGIDRIVPLAYAWRHGAAAWTPQQRAAFARDPLNLVAVDARQITMKADRGLAGWLPSNVAIRCAYAARFAEVAASHGLTLAPEDRQVARRQCAPA